MALRTDARGQKIGQRKLEKGEIVVEIYRYELELSWTPLSQKTPGFMFEEIEGKVWKVGSDEPFNWSATRNLGSRSQVEANQREWFIWESLPEKHLAAVKNFLKQLKTSLPKIK